MLEISFLGQGARPGTGLFRQDPGPGRPPVEYFLKSPENNENENGAQDKAGFSC